MSTLKTKLINNLNYNEISASVYSKCHFRCQYCGFDGLNSVDAYWYLQIDHILPKSKYPEIENDLNNQILACTVCNTFKFKFDPSKGEKFNLSDEKDRNELINKCRDYIFKKQADQTKIFLELKKLVFSHYQS